MSKKNETDAQQSTILVHNSTGNTISNLVITIGTEKCPLDSFHNQETTEVNWQPTNNTTITIKDQNQTFWCNTNSPNKGGYKFFVKITKETTQVATNICWWREKHP